MATTINPVTTSTGLPTLEAIERRRRELLSFVKASGSQHEPHLEPPPPKDPEPDDILSPSDAPAWHTPAPTAFYGLAGLAVRTIAPHTEADPAAILMQFLAAFGNVVGPGPHCMVESTRHGLNLFVVLMGESSKARKGSSWRQIWRLFSEVDAPWASHRVTSARLTADGLIHALRDQVRATDRRLLVLAEEFASVLHMLARQRGHLSPLFRSAWDGGQLRTLDRHHALQATGTHISLIGHITPRELAPLIYRKEAHNGFANRCLWACVRRSQCLPDGGKLAASELSSVAHELRRAVEWAAAASAQPFERNAAAQRLWNERYEGLSESRPGIHGAVTSRGEAQVLRLSAIYAALDCSAMIEPAHLEAALAVWDYCCGAAGLVFNASVEDEVAAGIRRALAANPDGVSRDQIRRLFHNHVSSARIDSALEHLVSLGAAACRTSPGRGRPTTLWEPVPEEEEDEQSETE